MNLQTIQLLNQLNILFYQTVASSFDETRARPWPGWVQLLPYVSKAVRVLDVGCGNGRFGVFLNQDHPIDYTGLDSDGYLLERARLALEEHQVKFQLHQVDIVTSPSPQVVRGSGGEVYDLITLFGVMHHIPGFEQRRNLLQRLYDRLAPGGILAVTFWLFYEQARFQERIVPWAKAPEAYQNLDLEPHDYLLDWRLETPALRYCHYVDQAESAQLTEGMNKIAEYEADGSNRYVLLRKD